MSCPLFKIPCQHFLNVIVMDKGARVHNYKFIYFLTEWVSGSIPGFIQYLALITQILSIICSFYLKKYRYVLSIELKEISNYSVNDCNNF
jgi:hypothetical protein